MMKESKSDDSVAEALNNIAHALHRLGNADAATPYGGLEALGMAIKESGDEIAAALNRIADAMEKESNSD